MQRELLNFAAQLREMISSEGPGKRVPDSKKENGDSCNPSLPDFNSLALELFALQFKCNAPYRKICEIRHLTPNEVEHWTQIPAVPAAAFKEFGLSCIPAEERTAVFHSSGTTEQKPSRHFHNSESLGVYEAALWSWFELNVLRSADGSSVSSDEARGRAARAPVNLICLTPPPERAPHSSLVHMFETARQKLGAPESAFIGQVDAGGTWALDFDAAIAALQNRQSSIVNHQLILGTAFSFVHLLDFLSEHDLRFQLPPGSRVMETGGYKNRSRIIPKGELHALITEWLGIPDENIVCEYGMSELCSQAYNGTAVLARGQEVCGRGAARPCHVFHFPPWARAQMISAESGREVANGETGLIRVFDLANVFSVMAIQTEDLGVRQGDGFELRGRAQMAEPRGCSLMVAEPLTPALSPLGGSGRPKAG